MHGWRSVFFTTGLGGLLWGVVWWFYYRNPRDSRANRSQAEFIDRLARALATG